MGAEDVDRGDPVFMCCSCFNRGNQFLWYQVLFPRQIKRIEYLLLKRPMKNRWWHGESVQEIRDENRAHGIGV